MDTSPTQHRPPPHSAYCSVWVTVVSVGLLLGCAAMVFTLGPILSLFTLGTFCALGAAIGVGLSSAVPGIAHPVQTFATVSACGAVAVFGITQAPSVVGPTALLLLAVAPPVLRFAARTIVRQSPTRPAGAFAGTVPEVAALLETLDKDELQAVWETSAVALERARGRHAVSHVVTVRQLCLDEFERREPETFNLWLLTQYPR